MISVTHLKNFHYFLLMFSLIAAGLVGFATIPLFPQTGIWYQSEPLFLALISIGGLNSLTLLLAAYLYPNYTKRNFYHPIVLIPLLLGLYSIFLIPFGYKALSQLLGSEQTGQGAVWFISLAVFTANARFLRKGLSQDKHKRLMWLLIAGCVFLSFLTVFSQGPWRMFFYNDHIGFWALYLWPLVFLLIKKKDLAFILALFVCFLVADISDNISAVLALIAMVILCALLIYGETLRLDQKKIARLGAVLSLGLILTICVFVWAFDGNWVVYKNLSFKIASTMHSRHLLLSTVVDGNLNELSTTLFGQGWGSFANMLMVNVPFDKTAVFYSGNLLDIHGENWIWDSLLRFDFHSHNIFVETFGNVGVFGLLLILAYFYSLIRFAKPEYVYLAFPCALGLILLNSMWFQMPHTLGLMAITFGLLSGQTNCYKRLKKVHLKSLLILTVIIFSYSIFSTYQLARAGHQQIVFNNETELVPAGSCVAGIDDHARHGHHFAEVFKSYVQKLNEKIEAEPETVTSSHWRRLEQLLCDADQRLEERRELISGVRALMARGDYLYRYRDMTKQHPALYRRMSEGWQKNLDLVMAIAPKRFDLAVPFYNWLLETGQEEELYRHAQKALNYPATKPIGLWFSGIVLLNDPAEKDKAVEMLKQSLKLGIEKFFPVEDGLKQALQSL